MHNLTTEITLLLLITMIAGTAFAQTEPAEDTTTEQPPATLVVDTFIFEEVRGRYWLLGNGIRLLLDEDQSLEISPGTYRLHFETHWLHYSRADRCMIRHDPTMPRFLLWPDLLTQIEGVQKCNPGEQVEFFMEAGRLTYTISDQPDPPPRPSILFNGSVPLDPQQIVIKPGELALIDIYSGPTI